MNWKYLSLQTKVISLIVLIVITVLSISTYFNIKASQNMREDNLRDEAILLGRELDISIGDRKKLAKKEWLEETLLELIAPYRAIQEFDVFSLTGRKAQLIATNLEGVLLSAYEFVVKPIRISKMVQVVRGASQRARMWEDCFRYLRNSYSYHTCWNSSHVD